jgi:O-antigen/teichoic acid export membrane protein
MLRATLGFGLGGVGFALGNLLLARALPTAEYGAFALTLALVQIGMPLAPAGAALVVNRRPVPADRRLLARTLATSAAVGAGTLGVGAALYDLGAGLHALAAAAIVAGGLTLVAAAQFQRRERFTLAVLLTQSQNAALLVAALLALAGAWGGALLPAAVLAAGCAVAAAAGWGWLRRDGEAPGPPAPWPWRESLSAAGVHASGLVLIQMERLVIPGTLGVAELATFAVLAALVGSPFRMLQLGVGYTLLARLRNAGSAAARRRLLRGEALAVLGVSGAACGILWFATPFLVELFLAGRYVLPGPLVLAMLVAGLAKVFGALAGAVLNATGTPRDLARLNLWAWGGVLAGGAGAIVGARAGLAGVVYGVTAGWLVTALAAARLAAPHLRDPAESPGASGG